MSYELQIFSKTPEFSERICGWIGNPPSPIHDGRNTSKVKLKVDAYYPPTHAEN